MIINHMKVYEKPGLQISFELTSASFQCMMELVPRGSRNSEPGGK